VDAGTALDIGDAPVPSLVLTHIVKRVSRVAASRRSADDGQVLSAFHSVTHGRDWEGSILDADQVRANPRQAGRADLGFTHGRPIQSRFLLLP
jgi:hypothetical protein